MPVRARWRVRLPSCRFGRRLGGCRLRRRGRGVGYSGRCGGRRLPGRCSVALGSADETVSFEDGSTGFLPGACAVAPVAHGRSANGDDPAGRAVLVFRTFLIMTTRGRESRAEPGQHGRTDEESSAKSSNEPVVSVVIGDTVYTMHGCEQPSSGITSAGQWRRPRGRRNSVAPLLNPLCHAEVGARARSAPRLFPFGPTLGVGEPVGASEDPISAGRADSRSRACNWASVILT